MYVCFLLIAIQYAVKCPILVRYDTVLRSLKGQLLFEACELKTFLFQLGFTKAGDYDARYQRPMLDLSGKIIVRGKIIFGQGARIFVGENAVLDIDDMFINTAGLTVFCYKHIKIGYHFTSSWDTLIMDTDFHPLLSVETGRVHEFEKTIIIGDNVWLCTRSVILKGACIPDGCVIGAMSLVTSKKIESENVLLAGVPAAVISRNVTKFRDNILVK